MLSEAFVAMVGLTFWTTSFSPASLQRPIDGSFLASPLYEAIQR
jgi:hypothetical protein